MLAQAVEDTVETVSEVNTTDLAVTAATYRRIPCTTVDTDRSTFTTVTFDCSFPFEISGTIRFERSSPEQLITITDLLINKTSIDSAKTLVIPKDPTLPARSMARSWCPARAASSTPWCRRAGWCPASA